MAQSVCFRIGRRILFSGGALALLLGLGCARHVESPAVVAPQPAVSAPVSALIVCKMEKQTVYDQGVCAYDAGEVKQALDLWREAATTEIDRPQRQKAMFALAAVKLSQAATDTELSTAMDLLEAWAKGSPPGGSGEDPRFLLPAVRAFRPGFALKELKASMERECAKKLSEREGQVRKSLQQQVRALESIHQQIQEKKKGLTNY